MARYRNVNSGAIVSVRDDKVLGAEWESFDGSESTSSTYGGMKVDELKAEIERRNEGREDADLLSTEGKKADLIATLVADDDSTDE